MGLFELRISKLAETDLLEIPFPFRRRINQRILRLRRDPFPPGVHRYDELGFCVLEAHGRRIVYAVDEDVGCVTLYRIRR